MAAVLTVVNNSTAVSNGFYRPRFTMNVKGLDTRKRTLKFFWLKFNTGELITPGYPITLDLRIE